MSREFTDHTGAPATVARGADGPVRSYTVRVSDGTAPAGRADYVETDDDGRVRVFFHTEVDPAFARRGLAGFLVRTALDEAIEDGALVVPVCPLFAAHLRRHGDEYRAEGGRFRMPRPSDVALVAGAVRAAARARHAGDETPRMLEILEPREVPLGGIRAMDVRRTLPQRARSLIGAWCFLDHFGPDELSADHAMQMPPHPHTGLQTVSWLFEGEVEHRDSTGAHEMVRPGELNLMTAGSGVQHSEYSTATATRLHGVQLWVALPDSVREMPATFEHHRARRAVIGDATALVFLGSLAGVSSDAGVHTPLVAAQVDLPAGASAVVPIDPSFEHGLLVDAGEIRIDGEPVPRNALAYLPPGRETVRIEAGSTADGRDARLVLIGGTPFEEEVVMWWNFVGRSHDEIVRYRTQWQEASGRFGTIDDPVPRLPAPVLPNATLRPRAAATADARHLGPAGG